MANKKVDPGKPDPTKVDPHSAATDKKAGGKKPGPNAAAVAAALASGPSGKKSGWTWEAALANYLGIAYNAKTKLFFDAWNTIDQSVATNNPFNITIDYTGGSTGKLAGNTSGVLNFDTPVDGIKATAAFILRRTPNIVAALKVGNYQEAATNVGNSGWAPSDPVYGNSLWKTFQSGNVNLGKNAPGGDLSPKDKAQIQTEAATFRAQSEAGNAAYIQATTDIAGQKKLALETAHISDPWITVLKDKKGNVVGMGQAIGANAPKNALMYGGQPMTKSDLSNVWNSRYAGIYEEYTGNVPQAADIVNTLSKGLSSWGLQSQLAARPSFTSSPIYKKSAAGISAESQQILGHAATPDMIRKAISQEWDQGQLDANLRKAPDYLQGPEYQNKYAGMKDVYQKIYGSPDANATQTIKQAAANGWDTGAFANYLRIQPEYTTSIEYQNNALGLLDNLGMMFRSHPTLTPGNPGKMGGTAIPTSPLVPGGSKVLNPVLKFAPTLDATPPALPTEQVRPQEAVPSG